MRALAQVDPRKGRGEGGGESWLQYTFQREWGVLKSVSLTNNTYGNSEREGATAP